MPLPKQAIEILRDIHQLTGPTAPVFRSMAKRSETSRCMSDNTINSALRTLGYDRATLLDQRRLMVQAWADLLDDLAQGKTVASAARRSPPLQSLSPPH